MYFVNPKLLNKLLDVLMCSLIIFQIYLSKSPSLIAVSQIISMNSDQLTAGGRHAQTIPEC